MKDTMMATKKDIGTQKKNLNNNCLDRPEVI